LLDSEFNPHLSDAGFASFIPDAEFQAAEQSAGYTAPEVDMTGQYTLKSDVYSFALDADCLIALDPDQSIHLCSGRLPSCMTSMHWTGWSILHSRVYTQPNLYPDLLMCSHYVSR